MQTLSIQIDCGETTCASEPGKFCKFLGSIKLGQVPVCLLFPSSSDSYTVLEDNGFVQRCQTCLSAQCIRYDWEYDEIEHSYNCTIAPDGEWTRVKWWTVGGIPVKEKVLRA